MDAVLCMKVNFGRIMTGSLDQSLRIWCSGSGRALHKMYGHKGSVSAVDFNTDWIVTGSWDMSLKVWDAKNYSHYKTLFGHMNKVTSVVLRHHYM